MSFRWDFPEPFIHRQLVEASAIDRLQHVNNARYLEFLEQAAWAHTAALGLDWDSYRELGAAVVAHRHEIDYLTPAREGDELLVGTWCTGHDGKLRLRRHYQILRASDGATVVRALTHWICVDIDSGRPKRMPQRFAQAYAPIGDAPPYP